MRLHPVLVFESEHQNASLQSFWVKICSLHPQTSAKGFFTRFSHWGMVAMEGQAADNASKVAKKTFIFQNVLAACKRRQATI